jgi:hypothetical protein
MVKSKTLETSNMSETPTPRAAPTVKPTPTQHENDQHAAAVANGTLPHVVIQIAEITGWEQRTIQRDLATNVAKSTTFVAPTNPSTTGGRGPEP